MKQSRILLADDHSIVIEGLRRILDRPGFEIVGVVNDGQALLAAAREIQPDIIIADVTMPLLNGIAAAREIHHANPGVRIIFLTMHSDATFATEGLAAGGCGYVLKSAATDELVTAICEVMKGRIYVSESISAAVNLELSARSNAWRSPGDRLTSRQREVLQMLAEGFQVKQIALTLAVSPRTVEFHKYRIMEQLGLRTTAEIARYAARSGIVA
jgi:DNA-binding NarL/FixJ family response regulator